jgi:hypothetical protein
MPHIGDCGSSFLIGRSNGIDPYLSIDATYVIWPAFRHSAAPSMTGDHPQHPVLLSYSDSLRRLV